MLLKHMNLSQEEFLQKKEERVSESGRCVRPREEMCTERSHGSQDSGGDLELYLRSSHQDSSCVPSGFKTTQIKVIRGVIRLLQHEIHF